MKFGWNNTYMQRKRLAPTVMKSVSVWELAGLRRSVVGCVSVGVDALAVVW